jgi:hypothetical protein
MNDLAANAVTTASINSSTISITFISVVNIGLLLWLGSRETPSENRNSALCSHALWSGMWLAWLLAWAAQSMFHSPIPAVVLEDIGSFLLIGCAIMRLWGTNALRRYAMISYPFLVVIDFVWPWLVQYEWSRSMGPAQADVVLLSDSTRSIPVFLNTITFAPSLCLVLFAMGLMGWSLLRLDVLPALRFTAALAAGGYALFQVLIYQLNLFTPGLPEGKAPLWHGLTLTWRLFFVGVYWMELLAWLDIRLPASRTQQVVSKLGWLPPVIVTVVLEHYLK